MADETSKTKNETLNFKWVKDFRLSTLIWCFVIIAVFVLFSKPIIKGVSEILTPFLSQCPNNDAGVNFILIVLSSYTLYIIFYTRLYKELLPTINTLFFSATTIFIYIVFLKTHDNTEFEYYNVSDNCSLTHLDVFLINFLLLTSSWKSYKLPLTKKSNISFIEDSSSVELEDAYGGREGYAKEIVKHIEATTCLNSSFAIGIKGDWGSGKTDFMNRMKKHLNENSKENIVFDFSPWRVNKTDAIINEFFKTLSYKLKP